MNFKRKYLESIFIKRADNFLPFHLLCPPSLSSSIFTSFAAPYAVLFFCVLGSSWFLFFPALISSVKFRLCFLFFFLSPINCSVCFWFDFFRVGLENGKSGEKGVTYLQRWRDFWEYCFPFGQTGMQVYLLPTVFKVYFVCLSNEKEKETGKKKKLIKWILVSKD